MLNHHLINGLRNALQLALMVCVPGWCQAEFFVRIEDVTVSSPSSDASLTVSLNVHEGDLERQLAGYQMELSISPSSGSGIQFTSAAKPSKNSLFDDLTSIPSGGELMVYYFVPDKGGYIPAANGNLFVAHLSIPSGVQGTYSIQLNAANSFFVDNITESEIFCSSAPATMTIVPEPPWATMLTCLFLASISFFRCHFSTAAMAGFASLRKRLWH